MVAWIWFGFGQRLLEVKVESFLGFFMSTK
jgi:hypothetical protein